jgi:hypothetical protein
MAETIPVPNSSEEFKRVEYALKLSLQGSVTFKDLKVWEIDNPSLRVGFERRSQGLLTLDSWCDLSVVHQRQSIEDIQRCGFTFPDGHMVFGTGSLELDRPPTGAEAPFQAMLCTVAVGRAFPLEAGEPVTPPPQGYDSVYLRGASTDVEGLFERRRARNLAEIAASRAQVVDAPGDVPHDAAARAGDDATASGANCGYAHRYALHDPSRVLPVFLVRFTGASAAGADEALRCDLCESALARVRCAKCDAKLCEACDAKHHAANKLLRRHERQPLLRALSGEARLEALRLGARASARCPKHPSMTVEFFDPVLHEPVCVHCKMLGSHSRGPAAEHALVGIAEAYEEALVRSSAPDPCMDERRGDILRGLQGVDARLRAVHRNVERAEAQIVDAFERAVRELRSLTHARHAALLSEELELRRQLQHVAWVEGFLRRQRAQLPPVDFLRDWGRHAALRSSLHRLRFAQGRRAAPEARADLAVVGRVAVVAGGGGELPRGRVAGGRDARAADISSPAAGASPARLGLGDGASLGLGSRPGSPRAAPGGSPSLSRARATPLGAAEAAVAEFKVLRDAQAGKWDNRASDRSRGAAEPDRGPRAALDAAWEGGAPAAYAPAADAVVAAMRQQAGWAEMSPGRRERWAARAREAAAQAGGIPTPTTKPASTAPHASWLPEAARTAHSLVRAAQRALRGVATTEARRRCSERARASFADTQLLAPHARFTLYLNLPLRVPGFGDSRSESPQPTRTVLLARSGARARGLGADGAPDALADVKAAARAHGGPTVLVARALAADVAGEKRAVVFGAFCSEAWARRDGAWCGDARGFLFSLNHGIRLPFHGRAIDAGSDAALPCARATVDTLEWGLGDLVLRAPDGAGGPLTVGKSDVEAAYGVGLARRSPASRAVLAGAPKFDVEQLELWGLAPAETAAA